MSSKINVCLVLEENRGLDRGWIPAQAGIPFPEGMLNDCSRLRLLDGDLELPLQMTPLCSWPAASATASIKWLLLDFLVRLDSGARKELRLTDGMTGVAPDDMPHRLKIEERAGGMVVDTGRLIFTVSGACPGIIGNVSADGASIPTEGLYMVIVDQDGCEYRSGVRQPAVTLEERGPVRTVLRVEGEHVSRQGGRCMRFVLRITCWAGSRTLLIRHALINCEGERHGRRYLELQRVGLEFPGLAGTGAAVFGNEKIGAGYSARVDKDLQVRISDATGATTRDPIRGGSLRFGNDRTGLVLLLKHFREQYPKEFRNDNGLITLNLWPGGTPLRYYSGMGKSHELLLGFYGSADAKEDICRYVQAHETLPRAAADAEWIARTGAVRGVFAAGRRFGAYPRIELTFKDAFRNRDVFFGMLNWGDAIAGNYSARGSVREDDPQSREKMPVWNNHEYDFPYVAFHQFIRTGEAYYFDEGETAVRHMLGVDYLHDHEPWDNWNWEPERSVHGVVTHCSHHGGNGWQPCHMWLGGILYYHLLTGDREALEKAGAIAESLAWHARSKLTKDILAGNSRGCLSREYGWPMIALSEMYEATSDKKYLGYLLEYVRVVERWEEYSPLLCNSGFCVALCLTGLCRYHAYTGNERVKALFLRMMDNMRKHLYMPEGVLRIKSTETRPGLYGGRPGFGTRACEALVYAYRLTGDIEFLRIGVRETAYLLDSGMLRQFVSQAALGAGATEYVDGHAVHRTIAHTADNRAIALNLRMLFPLLEAAHEAGLLQPLDYPICAQ